VLAVAAGGQASGGMLLFAKRRVLAVAGLGELAGACFFCGAAGACGGSWGGQTLSQAQCDRLAVQSVGLRLRGVSVKDSRCVLANALYLAQGGVC